MLVQVLDCRTIRWTVINSVYVKPVNSFCSHGIFFARSECGLTTSWFHGIWPIFWVTGLFYALCCCFLEKHLEVWVICLGRLVCVSFVFTHLQAKWTGPSGRAVWGVGLRPLACWDCGFEYHRRHGYLSVVSVVCCQVEISAMSWSLVQRSPTDCGASLCVI